MLIARQTSNLERITEVAHQLFFVYDEKDNKILPGLVQELPHLCRLSLYSVTITGGAWQSRKPSG